MSVRTSAVLLAVTFMLSVSVSASAASVTASHLELRIYDPARATKVEVTAVDVVRSAARASVQPGGRGGLYLRFTKRGALKFHALTLSLARRGTRLHRGLPFAFEINGRIRARPVVDYIAYPNGIDGSSGVEVVGMSLALARTLAKEIRGNS